MSPGRHRAVAALLVVATLLGFVSVFAVWAKRQLLETDTYAATSSKLLENKEIRQAVASFLVNELYANVNVEAELKKALPPQAQALAGPASGGLRQLAEQAALKALGRPRVQQLWEQANRTAQATLIKIVEGKGDTLSQQGGVVTLDLGSLLTQVGTSAGIDVSGKIPPDAGQIEVLRSDQLSAAQDVVNLLRKLAIVLPLLTLALFALAVYLSQGRRRETLRTVGLCFIGIGFLVLVLRRLGGNYVVGSLTSTADVEPAAKATWSIATSLLKDGGLAMIGYGVVIVLAAWIAGPRPAPTSVRRTMSPLLARRIVAYIALAVIFLLILVWSPTEGTRRLIPALIMLALFVAGMETLRAQTVREFPDETWEGLGATLRGHWAGARESMRRDRGAPAGARGPDEARLEQLERLARLKESGVLDEAELAREKQRILESG